MEGLSKKSPAKHIQLARSWLNPAGFKKVNGIKKGAYERGQRAYILEASDPVISVALNGTSTSPVVNPTFVIDNWDYGDPVVKLNGKKIDPGRNLKIGKPQMVRDKDLIIWLRYKSQEITEISIEGNG